MQRWIPYIMVRIAFCFASGILIGIYYPDIIPQSLITIGFFGLITGYAFIVLLAGKNYWTGTFAGCIALTTITFAGYLMVLVRTDSRKPGNISNFGDRIEFYSGSIFSTEEKINSTNMELDLDEIRMNGTWTKASGKILLYVSRKEGCQMPESGDRVVIRGSPQAVPSPLNPDEFDFRNYLHSKNISHQHRIGFEGMMTVSHPVHKGIIYRSRQARAWAGHVIKKSVVGVREQAITMALVLGVTEGIDNDLQDAYSASGAMHILSVSGLHAGIIYAIILLLLKPIRSLAWSRWIVAIVSLLCLWAYAFVTGLSPSVLRAVVMFSFMVVAKPFGRNTNIVNTLAASAFLLLIYNPFLILSVGFQLSYLAVLGIVYLQRPIYNLIEPSSIIWDKLWQITSVSLAAQAATFPPGLFYFHQFPVYFLISNILVVPLSTAVLVAGIGLLVVSPIAVLSTGVAWLIQILVRILNSTVMVIENLPCSVIGDVHISACQCWLLMAIGSCCILFVVKRKFYLAILSCAFSLIFGLADWAHYFADVNIDQLVVYNVPGHLVINRMYHGHSRLYSDTALLADLRQIRFHIRPYWIRCGIRDHLQVRTDQPEGVRYVDFHYFLWNGHSILCLEGPKAELPAEVSTDYLIVGNNAVASLENLKRKIHYKQLILASNNSTLFINRICKDVIEPKVPICTVRRDGAFVIKL